VIQAGANFANWLADHKAELQYAIELALSAALTVCLATGGGGGVGAPVCVAVVAGYAAYHTFQIMDALSNDEGDARWMNAFFKVVNALPWGGLAKTIFDNAVGGIGDPEPVH
jgi:hypothetical protein